MTDSKAPASALHAPEGFFSAPTDRPLSMSIVGWWLLVGGAMSPLSLLGLVNQNAQDMWSQMGMTPSLIVTHALISGLFQAILGYGILKGRPWARMGYIWFGAAMLVFSAVITTAYWTALVFGVVTYAVLCLVLSTPTARAYFAGTYDQDPRQKERQNILSQIRKAQKNSSDIMQIVGAGLAVIAGFLLMIAVFSTGVPDTDLMIKGLVKVGLPGLALLALGILFWGRARWRAIAGWCLLAVGSTQALSSVSVVAMQQSTMWDIISAPLDNPSMIDPRFFLLVGVTGLVLAIIGGGLLFTQYRMDGEVAERVLAKREATRSSHVE